jgi:glycosyltransferase involved in cell wall biosynthesis
MHIIHISYERIQDKSDPEAWLRELDFYVATLERMAMVADTASIHLINYSGILHRKGVTYHFLNISKWSWLFSFNIHRYIRRLNPDVVIVHGLKFPWHVLWLKSQIESKTTIIVMHHSEKPLWYHKRWLQRLADQFIDLYFFSSFDLGRSWVEAGQIKRLSKIQEVMIGSSVFCPVNKEMAKDRIKITGSPIYLWVGHLNENKDPFTLITAFKQFAESYPHSKLYMIYQQGDMLDKTLILIEGSQQIVLVEKVAHEELLYWYNSSDFIISTSFYEGGGVAVCEAMSCGCIPILTNIASFRMMTDHGKCGLLFTAGNPEELNQVLHKSINLNIAEEKRKVLDQFNKKLSNEAIVNTIMEAVKTTRNNPS